jgi:hypothetical protein
MRQHPQRRNPDPPAHDQPPPPRTEPAPERPAQPQPIANPAVHQRLRKRPKGLGRDLDHPVAHVGNRKRLLVHPRNPQHHELPRLDVERLLEQNTLQPLVMNHNFANRQRLNFAGCRLRLLT